MAHTIVGYDNASPPKLTPSVGSVTAVCHCKLTISGTTTSEAVVFPNLSVIHGWNLDVYDTNDEAVQGNPDVTASGNVLTVADASSGTFNLDASGYVIYLIVWGKPRAGVG